MAILAVANNPSETGVGEYVTFNSFMQDEFTTKGIRLPGTGDDTEQIIGLSISETPSGDEFWFHCFTGTTLGINGSGGSGSHMSTGFVTEDGVHLGGMSTGWTGTGRCRLGAFAVGNTTVEGGSYMVMTDATKYQIDVKLVITDTDVTISLYINGSLYTAATSSYTGARKKNPVGYNFNIRRMAHKSGFVYYKEAMFVVDEDPRLWRMSEEVPASLGNWDQWNGDYTDLTDPTSTSRITSDAAGQKTSMVLASGSRPGASGGIRSLLLSVAGSAGAVGGPTKIAPFIRDSGVDYEAAEVTLASTDRRKVIDMLTNPATSSGWSAAEIASLELGLVSKA